MTTPQPTDASSSSLSSPSPLQLDLHMKTRVLCIDGTSCCKKTTICSRLLQSRPFIWISKMDLAEVPVGMNQQRQLVNRLLDTRNDASRTRTLKVQRDRMIVRANTYFVSSFGYIIGGMLDVARYDNILRSGSTNNVRSGEPGALFAVMDRSPLNVEEWRLLWILMEEYRTLFGNARVDESCPQQLKYLTRFDDAFLNLRKCTWYRYFRSRIDTIVLIDSNVERCDRMRARRGHGSDHERCGWHYYTYLQNRMYKQLYRALSQQELLNFPWHPNIDGTDRSYLAIDAYIDLANLDAYIGGDDSAAGNQTLTTMINGAVNHSLLDEKSATCQVDAVVSAIKRVMRCTLDYEAAGIVTPVFASIRHKFYLPSPSKRCQRDPVEANLSAHVYREVGRTLVKRLRESGDTSTICRHIPIPQSSNNSSSSSNANSVIQKPPPSPVDRVYAQIIKRFKPLYPLEPRHIGNQSSVDDAGEWNIGNDDPGEWNINDIDAGN